MKRDLRKAFAQRLWDIAKNNPDIMVVTTDSRGSTALGDFFAAMPERFVEAGIAEQDAIGIATGLALCGKQAFACGPACFLMMRSQEQVKTDVAYSGANVKVVGVSAGVSYGVLGATHHALGDFAAARMMPGLVVLVPSDAYQAAAMATFLSQYNGPAYLRMGRGAAEDIYEKEDGCFTFGKANVLREGADAVIFSCGEIVHPSLEAAKLLSEKGIQASVLDVSAIRPFDEEAVRAYAHKCGLVVSAEEHFKAGGLGDAVSMAIWDLGKKHLRLGMPDAYMPCGSAEEIKAHCGLDAKGIAGSVLKALGR